MRPVLVEEFLSSLEENVFKLIQGQIQVSEFTEILQDNYELIADPILDEKETAEKLKQLVEYIKPVDTLDQQRAIKRLKNCIGMIERLRDQHLISKPDQSGAKQPSCEIKYAKGVGPKRESLLKKLGIFTLQDLIFYFPRDYEDRRRVIPIPEIRPEEKITTLGKIISVETKRMSSIAITAAVLSDGINQILLKWFNQEFLQKILQTMKNKMVYVTGTVKRGQFGSVEIVNPEIELQEGSPVLEILPIYPLTEGISQKELRKIVRENISCACQFANELPNELIERRKLIDISAALLGMHFPKSMYHLKKSIERLAYEELFLMQLALLLSRRTFEEIGGIEKNIKGKVAEDFLSRLPFKLTRSQVLAHQQIRQDMISNKPMSRLLQGDVGSGKTVVAQLAIIDNFEAGFQSAVMAPTSILAIQHYRRMAPVFEDLGIRTVLLLGETNPKEKERIKQLLSSGEASVVIGTHTLIQEDVNFANLGLVVIDEQHRFGVKQREALVSKGKALDTLVMTATPIPRTLALTVYGDLDLTIIDEMPPGRKEVKTLLVSVSKVDQVYDFVKREVREGGQAFVVYPLIEESEKIEAKAATQMYKHLAEEIFKEFKVGLLHGRMSQQEKDRIMEDFALGQFDILVSTTVIEVGIDIPRATTIIVENPERFGLAQLHQLRGRVGRSERQGYCFLIVGNVSEDAMERLRYFSMTRNGFEVAEYDMKIRGPGEFLGLRQHGLPELKVADLVRDRDLLFKARADAEIFLSKQREYPWLFEKVQKIYGDRLKLIKIG
ncbi:MAG: ATP-dependent DNA helicase RecG [Pseudothermotoga sp.]